MDSPGNQHGASCIVTLSFHTAPVVVIKHIVVCDSNILSSFCCKISAIMMYLKSF